MPPTAISTYSIVRSSAAAVATEVNGEIVLMSLERDRCYGLGSTGSEIWRRMQQPVEVAELARQLGELYDSAGGQIEADVLRTLDQLLSEGLIEVEADLP